VSVIDNAEELRYELRLDGVFVAEIRYRLVPGALVLVDVDVEPRLEGHPLLQSGSSGPNRLRRCRPFRATP
jgi:hypothetical protein